jgi:hypothetical protein
MKTRLFLVLGLCIVAALAAAGAIGQKGFGSARADAGGTPVNVNAFGCIEFLGGQRFVPAGSAIVIRQGYESGTRGAVDSFRLAQTTLLSVADGTMIDASDSYGEPQKSPVTGTWLSFLHHPTGVTLANPGDSMRFTFSLFMNRHVTDVFDLDGDGTPDPQPGGVGLAFGGTCTVTAF